MRRLKRTGVPILLALLLLAPSSLIAQVGSVTGHVTIVGGGKGGAGNRSGVVVWLTPLGESDKSSTPVNSVVPRLIQKDKRFDPHVLVIPAGTAVEFPNRDPFFHNVFSLFEGKRFDLGLYEAGTSRTVRFDRPGVSYIFCNIHPEMSAAVIAVKTLYYAISTASGALTIAQVPAGRYQLQVWHEGSSPSVLRRLTHEVTISEGERNLGELRVIEDNPVTAHKNKYGRDYDTSETQKSEYGPN